MSLNKCFRKFRGRMKVRNISTSNKSFHLIFKPRCSSSLTIILLASTLSACRSAVYARQPDQRYWSAAVESGSRSWYHTRLASRGTEAGSRSSWLSGNNRDSSADTAAWWARRELMTYGVGRKQVSSCKTGSEQVLKYQITRSIHINLVFCRTRLFLKTQRLCDWISRHK